MKKTIIILLVLGMAGLAAPFLAAQEQGTSTYNAAGRRDPFKNLLAGKEVKDKTTPGGISRLYIEDLNLTGIVKSRQKLTAICAGPQGFPYFLKVGDKLSDGYVLSIQDRQIVFRKTNERGIPMMRTKDIIKEINPEER
jgi:Tfp pilus assembly protein PilP